MLKRFFAVLMIFSLIQTQAWARASQGKVDTAFSSMVTSIMNGDLSQSEIVEQTKKHASELVTAGLTEREMIDFVVQKLSLSMSEQEVKQAIEEARRNPSLEKIDALAKQMAEIQSGEKSLILMLVIPLVAIALFIGVVMTAYLCLLDPYNKNCR
jgi:hypothetical protein